MADYVYIKNAAMKATIGHDCWHRKKPQQVLVSARLRTSIQLAGENDDVDQTINYGFVYKDIAQAFENSNHATLAEFARQVCSTAVKTGKSEHVQATVILPKGLLQAEGLGFEVTIESEDTDNGASRVVAGSEALLVINLKMSTLIGVNPHEWKDKQMIIMNLRLEGPCTENQSDYQTMLKPLFTFIENATYLTLEAFCLDAAKLLIHKLGASKVTLSVQKPNAYAFMEGPGVEITRSSDDEDMT